MSRKKILQKTLVVLILIIFCLEHLSVLSIAVQEATEFRLESKKYLISEGNGYISRIIPETTIEEFKSYFNTDVHVYTDSTLDNEVTEGYVATGMYLECHETEETYELSVIGDITQEGELNQIDLNLLIKHVVGLKEGKLSGINEVSADLSGDRKIDQVDITILIRYIVFHELYVPEIVRPAGPSIEVISGIKGDEDWYGSDVEVRIKENETSEVSLAKTVYKVTGVNEKEETRDKWRRNNKASK